MQPKTCKSSFLAKRVVMINSPHNLQHAVLLSTGRWLYIKTRCTFSSPFWPLHFQLSVANQDPSQTYTHTHTHTELGVSFRISRLNISTFQKIHICRFWLLLARSGTSHRGLRYKAILLTTGSKSSQYLAEFGVQFKDSKQGKSQVMNAWQLED